MLARRGNDLCGIINAPPMLAYKSCYALSDEMRLVVTLSTPAIIALAHDSPAYVGMAAVLLAIMP